MHSSDPARKVRISVSSYDQDDSGNNRHNDGDDSSSDSGQGRGGSGGGRDGGSGGGSGGDDAEELVPIPMYVFDGRLIMLNIGKFEVFYFRRFENTPALYVCMYVCALCRRHYSERGMADRQFTGQLKI